MTTPRTINILHRGQSFNLVGRCDPYNGIEVDIRWNQHSEKLVCRHDPSSETGIILKDILQSVSEQTDLALVVLDLKENGLLDELFYLIKDYLHLSFIIIDYNPIEIEDLAQLVKQHKNVKLGVRISEYEYPMQTLMHLDAKFDILHQCIIFVDSFEQNPSRMLGTLSLSSTKSSVVHKLNLDAILFIGPDLRGDLSYKNPILDIGQKRNLIITKQATEIRL